jgi:DNA-binding transcriptional LysR family regulator
VDAVLEVLPLRILDELVPEKRAQIQTNNITGQWLAASASLGVAALPVYTGDADRRLVRVLADTVTVNRTYWLVVPRDIRRLARVRAVVEILRGICNSPRIAHDGQSAGNTQGPFRSWGCGRCCAHPGAG